MTERFLLVEADDANLYPFTDTRPRYALPIANTPLLFRQIGSAFQGGVSSLVLLTPPKHVDAVVDLIGTLPAAQRKRIRVRAGGVVAAKPGRAFEPPDWLKVVYPWHVLTASLTCLRALRVKPARGVKSIVHRTARLEGPIAIGRRVVIEDHVVLKGPLVIGDGTVIRSGVYVEGPALIGSNCHLGPHCYVSESCLGESCAAEQNMQVVSSVFFEHVAFGHFGYIGHSVCAEWSGGGGGTVLFDRPLREPSVKVRVRGKLIDTGLPQLGPMVGAHVTSGVSAVLMPGIILGPNAAVGPGAVADRNVPASQMLFNDQKAVLMPCRRGVGRRP